MSISFEDVKGRRPLYKNVPVPEWGGDVRLQRLHAADRVSVVMLADTMERDEKGRIKHNADALRFGAELLALSIIDEGGKATFDHPDGRQFLVTEDPSLLRRLTDEAITLNGLGKAAAEAALDEAKKN